MIVRKNNTDCPRFGKWIKGCHFEPRYDLIMPDMKSGGVQGSARAVIAFHESLKSKVYICDVCTSCGLVVERDRKIGANP